MEDGDGYRHWDDGDGCHPDHLDRMLQMLIWEACGSLRKLCVSGLHNGTTFSFFADHAASLQTLRIPRSDISDSIVEQIAGKLSTITFLDVSYCTKISGCALEAIGKHCKLLAGLCRNMHPLLRPLVMEDFYVTNDWEEFWDDSDYDDQGELEELERIYETGDVELFGWYPSP
ncbi:F-BOX/TPR REPEAT PROTEIN POF3 [Salix koriyanagi]|uniref:F-BOX/TPR REPEAT PROTEIN POF3 n=2 Tax=Salix TaxID=40685 RepID=A0A9Q0SL61_9ROSI|nr:F-BOX/TPR REPEAT PROTEIN POF3 [Salix koriyanagi]